MLRLCWQYVALGLLASMVCLGNGMVLETNNSGVGNARLSSLKSNNHNLLPSDRSVRLSFFTEEPSLTTTTTNDSNLHQRASLQSLRDAQFAVTLKRRNGIDLYGKQVTHTQQDARFATLAFYNELLHGIDSSRPLESVWDATLLLEPTTTTATTKSRRQIKQPATCFVAMNRFHVKEECFALFEDRWAKRNTQLPVQPNFVGFSLLRRQSSQVPKQESSTTGIVTLPYNYASCTIWESYEAWTQWRKGDGRNTHVQNQHSDTSRKRTPASEWMHSKASPIFWDGLVHSEEMSL